MTPPWWSSSGLSLLIYWTVSLSLPQHQTVWITIVLCFVLISGRARPLLYLRTVLATSSLYSSNRILRSAQRARSGGVWTPCHWQFQARKWHAQLLIFSESCTGVGFQRLRLEVEDKTWGLRPSSDISDGCEGMYKIWGALVIVCGKRRGDKRRGKSQSGKSRDNPTFQARWLSVQSWKYRRRSQVQPSLSWT